VHDKLIILAGDGLGSGDPTLGHVILANFLRLLAQRPDKPAAIVCWNAGVRLVCDGASAFEAQEHLRELAVQGVPVYACRTCLEHFGLLERVVVGQIGGMPQFVELMARHETISL